MEVTQESGFCWCRIATIRIHLPRFSFTRGSQWQSMVFSSGSDPFGLLRANLDWLLGLGVVFDHAQTHTGASASMVFYNKPNPLRAHNVSIRGYPRAYTHHSIDYDEDKSLPRQQYFPSRNAIFHMLNSDTSTISGYKRDLSSGGRSEITSLHCIQSLGISSGGNLDRETEGLSNSSSRCRGHFSNHRPISYVDIIWF